MRTNSTDESKGSVPGAPISGIARIKRLCVLPATVLIQTCLGGVYAWSAFVPALREDHGFTSSQTQLVFGLAIAMFTIAMVPAGRLLLHWGPRRVALLGCVLFTCGHLLAAASAGRFLWLLCGMGLIGGASIGCGYVAALTTSIQWFPRHRGLVTGIAVAGFGGGAVALSSLAIALLHHGWNVLDIFKHIGWGYGATAGLAALFLFRPPSFTDSHRVPDTDRRVLRDALFRRLAAGMFCGTFAGLLVIGNLKPIGIDGGLTPHAATLAISLFALGNAAGRITWGWLADRMGYKTIPLALLFLFFALALLLPARVSAATFAAGAFLTGFGFGACFVLYAAHVAARYGADAVARIYPLIFLAYGLAGVTGPTLGGHLHDLTGDYFWSIAASMAVLAMGTWVTWRGRAFASGSATRRHAAR